MEHKLNEIILKSREDADKVLEALIAIIKQFKTVTIADFHDLVGLPNTYEDNKWGWSSMDNVKIRQVDEGYSINFPPAESV